MRRLKALKRKEVEEKLLKLLEVAGEGTQGLDKIDLEGDWDPEEHDRKMAEVYAVSRALSWVLAIEKADNSTQCSTSSKLQSPKISREPPPPPPHRQPRLPPSQARLPPSQRLPHLSLPTHLPLQLSSYLPFLSLPLLSPPLPPLDRKSVV